MMTPRSWLVSVVILVSLGCAQREPGKDGPKPQFRSLLEPDDVSEPGHGISAVAAKPPPPAPVGPELVCVKPAAVSALQKAVKAQGLSGTWRLRIRLVSGGCSGFLHKLDLDPEPLEPGDQTFRSGEVIVVVAGNQVDMFRGAEVDYGREGDREGFKIKNPNFEGEGLKKWLPLLMAQDGPMRSQNPAKRAERIREFQTMTEEDPKNELGHFLLGQLLMEDGRYATAAHSFERALELSPDVPKSYLLLGQSLIKSDQKTKAVTVLTKGWSVADKSGNMTLRDAMGILLKELGAPLPAAPTEEE